jgi:hypothetical protein
MNDEHDEDRPSDEEDPDAGDPEVEHAPPGGKRAPTWLEVLVPSLIVLLLFALALMWNIVVAIVVLIIGAGVLLSWIIQRHEPHEPGE